MRLVGICRVLAGVVLLATALQGQVPRRPTPSSRAATHATAAALDPGSVANSQYHNPSLGFGYRISFGWVDRTKEMQEDAADPSKADPSKSLLLLAVFERPPEAAGDAVNSAVVIAAESVTSYPGLKSAADYFGPLTEITTGKGFKAVSEPYEFPVGAKQLVRGDFSRELGTLTMHQASLVMVQKGYVVSFTFIAGSEDEVEHLISNLSFVNGKQPTAK